jgi:hypothetical protein
MEIVKAYGMFFDVPEEVKSAVSRMVFLSSYDYMLAKHLVAKSAREAYDQLFLHPECEEHFKYIDLDATELQRARRALGNGSFERFYPGNYRLRRRERV